MLKFKDIPFDVDENKAFEEGFAGALTIQTDEFGGKSAEYSNPWTKNNKLETISMAWNEKAMTNVAPGGSINTQTGGA